MANIAVDYIYKVYDGTTYKGLLPKPISDFYYTQAINTVGTQLEIKLPVSFADAGATSDTDLLVDQAGNRIVDENGAHILTRQTFLFNNLPMTLGYRVVVVETSQYNPTGKTVFDGFIYDWTGDYAENTITLIVMSHGVRLDNYILDPSTDINTSQLLYDTEVSLSFNDKGSVADAWSQTFQLAVPALLSKISLYMRSSGSSSASAVVTLSLITGTPLAPGATLATVSVSIQSSLASLVDFAFSTPVSLAASTSYYFEIVNSGAATSSYATPLLEYKNSNVYASGQLYSNLNGAGYSALTADAAFILTSSSGTVSLAFGNYDPGTIVKSALNVFNSKGGLVTYSAASVDLTGITTSYTFLLATIYETIIKGYQLAPSSWYWYVDIATNLLHMHNSGATANHTFILGTHINTFKIGSTLETVRNIIYFSGGDTGAGSNLFRINKDQSSITNYGQWLERESDNRVTVNATADLLSVAKLGKYSVPSYNVELTVPLGTYDISLIALGQRVAIRNCNSFIDALLFQIIQIDRYADHAVLKLGLPIPRTSQLLDDVQRRVIQLETVNNPSVTT